MLNDILRLLDGNFSVVEENKTIENNIYIDVIYEGIQSFIKQNN